MNWSTVYSHLATVLAQDDDLSRMVLAVRYEDLCQCPIETLLRLYNRCALGVTEEVLQAQASFIEVPRHDSFGLSEDEIQCIHENTKEAIEGVRALGDEKLTHGL